MANSFTGPDPSLQTSHSVSINGLQPGHTYGFKVHSHNAGGTETVSATQTFSTPATNATIVASPATLGSTGPAAAKAAGSAAVQATSATPGLIAPGAQSAAGASPPTAPAT